MEQTQAEWREEIDNAGDVWVVGPGDHRYFIGNLEETCKICHEHARLFVGAPGLHRSLLTLVDMLEHIETGLLSELWQGSLMRKEAMDALARVGEVTT